MWESRVLTFESGIDPFQVSLYNPNSLPLTFRDPLLGHPRRNTLAIPIIFRAAPSGLFVFRDEIHAQGIVVVRRTRCRWLLVR